VDNNVTRNIPSELKNEDWNGMVMHYLGLDHIGHKSGPRRCICADSTHSIFGSLIWI